MSRIFGALLALALFVSGPHAQDYPSKPIRFVVPYPPGGAVDAVGRVIAQKLSDGLHQPVVVENRAGASGVVGAQNAINSAPDGYTLLFTTPTVEDDPRFDARRDTAAIAMVALTPIAVVVKRDSPLTSVDALIAAAKAAPGKFAFATTGAGSINQLVAEWFSVDAGIKMLHVPYRGGAPAVTGLLAGDVQVGFLTPSSVRPLVEAGQFRVLAVSSKERLSFVPTWPTFAESGLNIEAAMWFGLLAPPKTPPDVIGRLDAKVRDMLADDQVRHRLNDLGAEVSVLGHGAFSDMMQAERTRYRDVIRRTGIKFEN